MVQYSKKGKSYIFPSYVGKPEVIVPRSSIRWLLEQVDDVLSSSAAHWEMLEGEYTFTNPRVLKDPPFHEHVIHRSLSRQLGTLIMDRSEERRVGKECRAR